MKYLNIRFDIITTLQKGGLNIPEFYTKNGTLKVNLQDTLADIVYDIYKNKKEEIYHLKQWSGSRKHMTLVETKHDRMIDCLDSLGIKYELGNDAPRGGITGDYILIKYDYRNKNVKSIKEILKNNEI